MASLDASHETTVPSGTLVSRRTLKLMGVGIGDRFTSHADIIAVIGRIREAWDIGPNLISYATSCLDF